MLNAENIDYVQSAINYHFKNQQLLVQAFIRKSFAQENPDVHDNEVLEFYGDEALDLYVTKMMYKKFSKFSDDFFVSEKSEGELTKFKSVYVSKRTLAQCSYNAGFYQYLFLGKSDIANNVQKSQSVNEDLFEAIVGAVAVDCDWDFKTIEHVCETMLSMDSMNSYLCVLVQEKCQSLGFGYPEYVPGIRQPRSLEEWRPHNWWEVRIGCQQGQIAPNPKTGLYDYGIRIAGKFFAGSGKGPFQAKMDAESKALNFLYHEELKRKIKKIDYSNPVSQLHEFVQKEIIMEPIYDFTEYHDKDGNPIWRCNVTLESVPKTFTAEAISKKEVKQEAVLQLLKYFVETEVEESEEWETPTFFVGELSLLSDEEKEKLRKEFDEAKKQLRGNKNDI